MTLIPKWKGAFLGCHFYLFIYSFCSEMTKNVLLNVRFRHAEVMKKIIETVAEGGGELGVHMYPFVRKNNFYNFTFTLLHFGYYDTCVASSCMN